MNQKLVIWGTVPEKQSETDRIFCHFGPCFALLPHYWPQTLKFGKNVKKPSRYYPFKHVYHKWRSYHVWFLRYKGMRENVFCHFGPSFAPSDPPNNWKNQNFEKIKKSLEILSFYTCVPKMTIIWCMVPEIWSVADIFVSFWTIFWPFTPLTQKIKILKKRNKHLEVSLFYTSVP